MSECYSFVVNGVPCSTEEEKPLLRYLRDELRLTSVKDGCSEGACGTCTILVDGKAVKACVLSTKRAAGKEIVTVEGLSEAEREAFVYAFGAVGAVQCGFCIPGMVMAGKALLDQNPNPSEAEIKKAIRGSKIVIPSDAYTAKGLLKSAIRDNNPVIVVEHRKHYSVEFDMPDDGDENLLLPIGKSVVVHEGSDVTVVANSFQVGQCVKVAKHLEKKKGVSVEVVDLRTLVPLDKETIIKSVKKTGRLLIVDEGYTSFGVAAEICAAIQDEVFYDLDAPIQRLCAPDVSIPFSPALEKLVVPNENTILAAVEKLL